MACLPLDGRHADARELVAVTAPAAILAAALELEDADLLTAPVLDDLGGDHRALHRRLAHRDLLAVADQQHVVELEARAGLAREPRNVEDLVGRDLRLDAGDVHDRVHEMTLSSRDSVPELGSAVRGRSGVPGLQPTPMPGGRGVEQEAGFSIMPGEPVSIA